MPLLNPPLPELNHVDVHLYYDYDPSPYAAAEGTYLLEIVFKPGCRLISDLFNPEGITYLLNDFEISTMAVYPDYQEDPKVIFLGKGIRPDNTNPPQDTILMIHFRELGENQMEVKWR